MEPGLGCVVVETWSLMLGGYMGGVKSRGVGILGGREGGLRVGRVTWRVTWR